MKSITDKLKWRFSVVGLGLVPSIILYVTMEQIQKWALCHSCRPASDVTLLVVKPSRKVTGPVNWRNARVRACECVCVRAWVRAGGRGYVRPSDSSSRRETCHLTGWVLSLHRATIIMLMQCPAPSNTGCINRFHMAPVSMDLMGRGRK
jgi:hypothetical protein